MTPKESLRKELLARRKAISLKRREEAAIQLKERFCFEGRVLSFTPIGSEIDTRALNHLLEQQKRLVLVPYDPNVLFQLDLTEIDYIIVPGLGFDREGYRIGYGKGWYDRFLSSAKTILTVGVGFQEQLCDEPLPRDPWDIPVKELLLV